MKTPSRASAILLALLVTFFWSTSFIIIKRGLVQIPPLTFAGLRYSIAFICLLPFALKRERLEEIRNFSYKDFYKLGALGFLFYTFTQGTQFIGLSLLPAVTVSLILNFTPVIVSVMGIFLISERPSKRQWIGALLFITGVFVYFLPADLSSSKTAGLLIMAVGVFANAGSSVLGRSINKSGRFHPLSVTTISMGIGSITLLLIGLVFQGMPPMSAKNILFLLWLAAINTALAFTIWNLTLRSLTAMESSIINGTMLIQIALLAWVFLGESITIKEGFGMFIAALGALLVQLRNKK